MNDVTFSFTNEEQMNIFVKWFQKEGINNLFLSTINTGKRHLQISVISTDEKIESGHYFELE